MYLRQNGTFYWFITDRIGIPQKLITDSGRVVWAAEYNSYGNCIVIKDEIENPLRLPGQYLDTETGLYYNLHRYYDPKIGRYLQVDPAGDGLNLYAYVGGNPVNAIDPQGLCAARMMFGITEAVVGYGFLSSGVGSFADGLMMMNGIDEAVAGFWGLWSGQPTRSALENAIHAVIPNEMIASSVHVATQLGIPWSAEAALLGRGAWRGRGLGGGRWGNGGFRWVNERAYRAGQLRAERIVRDAAYKMGCPANILLDDVVYVPYARSPYFNVISGRRTIVLNKRTVFLRDSSMRLLKAAHELGHTQVSLQGKLMTYFQEEVWVESLA